MGVAIFAVLSTLLVSTLSSNGDRNAKLEAQRFIAVVNEVRDEALISGRTLVLELDEKNKNYGFSVFGGEQQEDGPEDSLLRTRRLHESVKLKWEVFEEFDDEEQEAASDTGEIKPKVYITALGELTPFKARFGGDENVFIVELDNEGALGMSVKSSGFF